MYDRTKRANKRLTLVRTVKLLVIIGFGFVTVPFLGFLISTPDEGGLGENIVGLVVALEELNPGEIKEVDWLGRPIWIYHRTREDIKALRRIRHQLGDPESQFSEQPEQARNPLRSLKEDYFVFVPRETSRNCQVHYVAPDGFGTKGPDWYGGFVEPCHGARFDLAGRIYDNSGTTQQRNLTVPIHRFLSQNMLEIGTQQENNQPTFNPW